MDLITGSLGPSSNPASNPPPDLPPVPRGCTHHQLRQLMRRVGQHYDGALAAAGLKTTQYSLLSMLLKLAPIRPGDLARAMSLEPSTLTRNLQPLIKAGWVTLSPGSDGRSRQVQITPAGADKRACALQYWRQAQDGLNQTLGPARVAALHSLIQDALVLLSPVDAEPDDA
jgi:DNA-binding MarR family transcriptional regulator